MYTYKLTFDYVVSKQATAETLGQAHARIVDYMRKHGHTRCTIDCGNGIMRRVWQSGQYHPVHDTYSFD
jgi:hypothetical protein